MSAAEEEEEEEDRTTYSSFHTPAPVIWNDGTDFVAVVIALFPSF